MLQHTATDSRNIKNNNSNSNNNKHPSNLVKGGIVDRCCQLVNHKSFLFVSYCMLWLGVRPQISGGTPSNTMCPWTPQVYLPNGI